MAEKTTQNTEPVQAVQPTQPEPVHNSSSGNPTPPNEKAGVQDEGHAAPHNGGNHHEFRHHHITEYVHLPRHHAHIPHGIHEDGESNRSGLTWHFFKVVARSSCVPSAIVNVLWPFVPVAIALHFARPDLHFLIFAFNYIAMVPSANLLGFAGQELARKLPKVFGILLETFLGGLVEIVLFTSLIVEASHSDAADASKLIAVIQAAILGSILANLLFCMGLCFVAGGFRHVSQKFDGAITEVGCGLLLMSAFGLSIPRAFGFSLEQIQPPMNPVEILDRVTKVSRIDAVILMIAYFIFVFFQMFSHHGLYSSIFEADEQNDRDRDDDLAKTKLTLTECLVAIAIALTFVSFHAVFLVQEIDFVISNPNVSEMFLGLILVPLVEKFAEHLTAIDEAWDNTMNLALAHILGATLQTALFNTSLVVIIGWGLGVQMNLAFSPFLVIISVLAIIAVGSFLRDQESNYLEGSLCVLIYILIAASAYYFPDEDSNEVDGFGEGSGHGTTTEGGGEAASTVSEAAAHATSAAVGEAISHIARMLAKT